MPTAQRVRCELDGEEHLLLAPHLAEIHRMSVETYLTQFPDAPVESPEITRRHADWASRLRRRRAPDPSELRIRIGNVDFPVNWDVPESACLPLPAHYRLPTAGDLGKDVARALRYFRAGRSTWIWGSTGAGKDALPSAVCALTRTPSAIFPINPDVDILTWFYDKTLSAGGTGWEFGELFRALVEGYKSPTGRHVPMLVLLSDFDRAGRSQAEAIRLVADTIQGRVKGPRGETYPVLPGTRIVITANTMGGGDASGKCISANVLDSSIINRIERKVKFHQLAWDDEEPVLRAKFPIFDERCGHMFGAIGAAVSALRKAVDEQNLFGEFSHRDLCTWIGDCEDILQYSQTLPRDLLRQGFMSYADGLPDEQNRNQALTLVDPHIRDGGLPRGPVVGVREDEELKLWMRS
jgi:hypothetical protein